MCECLPTLQLREIQVDYYQKIKHEFIVIHVNEHSLTYCYGIVYLCIFLNQ